MSSEEVRKVSREDIQLVQNLIERCLQLYMTQKEVVNTLLHQAKIEPGFTELVWQKLEEENQEFFQAYHLRLIVKNQISRFNRLLERQVELMRQICPSGVAPIPMSNGSHIPPMHQNSACYPLEHTGSDLKPENMHHSICTGLPNGFGNGGSSLHPCMSAHDRRIDVPMNMLLAQSSNVGMVQGTNGGMIKSEAGYPCSFPFMFGADGSVLEMQPTIGDANNTSSGFVGQISRQFLSDLTADFSNSSDILESYSRSPFLATDTDNFLDPHGMGQHQGDIKRLDTISEGFSYDDFGSD